MAEYIEREMALKAIDEYFHTTNPDGEEQIGVLKSRKVIRTLPTADVEVVKHGRWEHWRPKTAIYEYSFDEKECSECGYVMQNALIIPAYYCPNCGAKMMEVDDG